MFKFFFALITTFFVFFNSNAEIVNDIVVKNNKRVAPETILVFGNISKGKNYERKDLDKILKELYKTNFFSDVKIDLSNGILTIDVIENKIIQSIIINGLKTKKIEEFLNEQMTLKDKSPYVEYLVYSDLIKIKNSLKSVGYYFVKVDSSIVENNNDTINLVYDIELGEKALISEINFVGNKVYKDRKLRSIIASEEGKFWKFVTSKKFLDKSRIELDKRLLKNFYLNNGYYDVVINNSFVEFLDKNNFKLIYNIESGPIFKIQNTKLTLPVDYDPINFENVKKILKKLEGEKYSFKKLSNVVDEIDKITLRQQFEFITASINEQVVDGNKLNLDIEISETKKSYVERVDIFGNDVTQENVIRNELVVDEGDPFNELLHAKSINNLKSRNLFGKVESEIVDGSKPGLKIIKLTVEDKPTGEISLGAGVGTDGSTIGFSVTENNYMGKGIRLDTSLRVSEDQFKGSLTVTNPNFNYTDNSLSTTIQSTTIDKLDDYGYESSKTGMAFSTNFEQYDDFYIAPRISVFYEKLDAVDAAAEAIKKQEGNFFDTLLFYQLDLDKRNQRFQTSDGYRSTFVQELPILSEDNAILNGYSYDYFTEFENEMITKVSLYTRAINGLSTEDVRISNRVSVPSKKLRGFQAGGIGPVDGKNYIGGNYATAFNIATTLPMIMPNLQNTDFSFFVDTANVWGVDFESSIDESNKIRSSTGVAVNWYTPIGPLNFSLAKPITKTSTDKTEAFRFNLGTTF